MSIEWTSEPCPRCKSGMTASPVFGQTKALYLYSCMKCFTVITVRKNNLPICKIPDGFLRVAINKRRVTES